MFSKWPEINFWLECLSGTVLCFKFLFNRLFCSTVHNTYLRLVNWSSKTAVCCSFCVLLKLLKVQSCAENRWQSFAMFLLLWGMLTLQAWQEELHMVSRPVNMSDGESPHSGHLFLEAWHLRTHTARRCCISSLLKDGGDGIREDINNAFDDNTNTHQ